MNDAQAGVFEQAAEIRFAIAAEMPGVLVERRKEPLKRRNDENEMPAGSEQARHAAHRFAIFFDMFQHIQTDHRIEDAA